MSIYYAMKNGIYFLTLRKLQHKRKKENFSIVAKITYTHSCQHSNSEKSAYLNLMSTDGKKSRPGFE